MGRSETGQPLQDRRGPRRCPLTAPDRAGERPPPPPPASRRGDPLSVSTFSRPSPAGLIFWLLCACFLAFYLLVLEELPHNQDEGVSIVYGRYISLGKVPYLDFFYHQLPLHLFLYAFVSWLAPESLLLHRLPSLLAVAATGGVVYKITRRLAPASAAPMAVALFYFVPLQYNGTLAMPNGLMMLFSTLSVYLIIFRDEGRPVRLGAFCLAVAVLLKPLAMATAAVIGVLLLIQERERWKLTPVTVIGTTVALASWLGLHLLSDGLFTELLELQFHRFVDKAWFDRMLEFTMIESTQPAYSIRSSLSWNLYSHVLAFSYFNLAIVLTALGGAWIVWRRRGGISWDKKVLLALWLLFPLLFSLFVWEPAWVHYHVQYLPPLAILGALFLQRLWNRSRVVGPLWVTSWLAISSGLGILAVGLDLRDYEPLRTFEHKSDTLLTFDPFINFVTRTEAPCGLTDPVNQTMPRFFRGKQNFLRFIATTPQIIDCLEESPDLKVLISTIQPFTLFQIDEEMYGYLRRQDESRIIFPSEDDRATFETLFD